MLKDNVHLVCGEDGGGVLLDRATGNILYLNQLATKIWSDHIEGLSVSEIASTGSCPTELDQDEIAKVLRLPTRVTATIESSKEEHRWDPEARRLWRFEHEVLELSEDGKDIRLLSRNYGSLRQALACIATKALGFCGALTLHGSAVVAGGKVLAISGPSGAGKTTTARAFARSGARLVSEDKLVISLRSGGPKVIAANGESRINRWIEASFLAFSGGQDLVKTEELFLAAEDPEFLPLNHLYFLSCDTRLEGVPRFLANPLAPSHATAQLIRQTFFGSPDWTVWTRHADVIGELVGKAKAFELQAPNGLDRLAAGANDYILNLTE